MLFTQKGIEISKTIKDNAKYWISVNWINKY